MRNTLASLLVAALIAPVPALPAGETVTGASCETSGALAEALWTFPVVAASCAACDRTINSALASPVASLLGGQSLSPGVSCDTLFPDQRADYSRSVECHVTLQTTTLVSLQCSSEGHSPGGSAIRYTSLLFTIDRQRDRATIVPPENFFHPRGRAKVRAALESIIRNQHRQAGEDTPNGQIEEDDIPALATQMLETATFHPHGVTFLALGDRRSAFETTLAFAAIRKWLAKPMNDALAGVD